MKMRGVARRECTYSGPFIVVVTSHKEQLIFRQKVQGWIPQAFKHRRLSHEDLRLDARFKHLKMEQMIAEDSEAGTAWVSGFRNEQEQWDYIEALRLKFLAYPSGDMTLDISSLKPPKPAALAVVPPSPPPVVKERPQPMIEAARIHTMKQMRLKYSPVLYHIECELGRGVDARILIRDLMEMLNKDLKLERSKLE
jgi:hypothetical protein